MRRKTPQQKKSESYERDRRNTYGENDKSSRKNIPRNKRIQDRKYRNDCRRALDTFNTAETQDDFDIVATRINAVRRKKFHKWPFSRLRDVVQRKLNERAEIQRREAFGKARLRAVHETLNRIRGEYPHSQIRLQFRQCDAQFFLSVNELWPTPTGLGFLDRHRNNQMHLISAWDVQFLGVRGDESQPLHVG